MRLASGKREAKLAEAEGKGEAVGNPSIPRVKGPRTYELALVVVGLDVAPLEEGIAKEPIGEHEETVHE